jgi:hypothetical protein
MAALRVAHLAAQKVDSMAGQSAALTVVWMAALKVGSMAAH